MGHSKAFLLQDMRIKSGAIVALLLREDVNIKPDHLQLEKESDQLKMVYIRPGFHWIREVFAAEFEAVLRIKKLQPKEMWTRYKNWGGFEDHREVVLLKEALTNLRAKVVSRERPDVFKKSKRAKEIKRAGKRISKAQGVKSTV